MVMNGLVQNGWLASTEWDDRHNYIFTMSHCISEYDRVVLTSAAITRKLAMNADMFADRVFHCMMARVLGAGSKYQQVLLALPGVYIDEYHSVESQIVFNFGKCPSIAGTNVYTDTDSMFCTHVKYITSHMQAETSSLVVFRQVDDGRYVREI